MHAAFIGIGEVGSCLARELARRGLEVTAYRRSQLGMRKAVQAGVSLFGSLAEALEGADVVFSCVWPHTALEVAKEAAALLRAGQLFADLNSISPGTAQRVFDAMAGSGAEFAKVAIMASVHENGISTPMVAGGPGAHRLTELMNGWGMHVSYMAEDVRAPAAFKILRAYGLKAVTAASFEMLRAGRRYGLDEEILASVADFWSWPGYRQKVNTSLGTMAVHAERRAQEMDEVMETLQDIGLDSSFARSVKRVYARIGAAGLKNKFGAHPPTDYRDVIDALEQSEEASPDRD